MGVFGPHVATAVRTFSEYGEPACALEFRGGRFCSGVDDLRHFSIVVAHRRQCSDSYVKSVELRFPIRNGFHSTFASRLGEYFGHEVGFQCGVAIAVASREDSVI